MVKNKPKISIVFVNYNSAKETINCLIKLGTWESPITPIVIDNSSELSIELAEHCTKQNVKLLSLTENKGYAAAANEGILIALNSSSDYILVFNTDVDFDESSIWSVVDAMEKNDDIWVAGPCIYDLEGGKRTPRIQSCGQYIDKLTGKARSHHPLGLIEDVEYVSGACLFLKDIAILENGFLDEGFFLYYEETEYCYRLLQKFPDKKICIINYAPLWHEQGASTSNIYSTYYGIRNKITFHKAFFPKTHIIFLLYVCIFTSVNHIITSLLQDDFKLIHVWWIGFADGIRGIKGKSVAF